MSALQLQIVNFAD